MGPGFKRGNGVFGTLGEPGVGGQVRNQSRDRVPSPAGEIDDDIDSFVKRKLFQNFRTAGGNSKPYGCVESIKRESPAGSITRGGGCDEL